MNASPTPRQIAKGLLRGEAPPRPLLLPIVFALGAKVENVAFSSFLTNPTKIVNAARQLRGHLQADGVTCYFDPYIEVEALGATIECGVDEGLPLVHWRQAGSGGELPEGTRSPEDVATNGRIPVAVEVISRLNATPGREFLLTAAVSGPLALAELLLQTTAGDCSTAVLEFTSNVTTLVATAYLEAGADVVFLREQVPAGLSKDRFVEWLSHLAPTINLIRFYEALPVLHLADTPAALDVWEKILHESWECVVCAPSFAQLEQARQGDTENSLFGVALPLQSFGLRSADSDLTASAVQGVLAQTRPVIITTADDIPATTDIKQLKNVFAEIVHYS